MPEWTPPVIEFPPFRLDLRDERLWRGQRPIEVRPRTFAVLRHLAEHPGRLVTRDELLDAVWGDVAVAPVTLSQSIRELRRALGDDARAPRFIETVHRRGFRFRARTQPAARSNLSPPAGPVLERAGEASLPGRHAELKRLEELLEDAQNGRRRVVFVTGEAGIGKSRLVQEFSERLALRGRVGPLYDVRGDCIEYHGESEPYRPLLDALERLARRDGHLKEILRSRAPHWLAQLPWLLSDDESAALGATLSSATPMRMLRELCVALEAFAVDRTLVLWLEDLHWSDPSTIDLLASLARRPEPARLLVVGTYRPADAAMSAHPIARSKRRLVQEGLVVELALGCLDAVAIEDHLRRRFGTVRDPSRLAGLVHEQTEGNPLFMVSLLDHMVAERWLVHGEEGWQLAVDAGDVRTDGLDSLRALVESQLEDMSPADLGVLEAASVVGENFSAQAVAAAVESGIATVEEVCERLAGWGSLLKGAGRGHWPDGSAGQRYRFLHSPFRQILYERVPAARVQESHRRIGERLATGFAGHAEAPAAELARHFEKGGVPTAAVHWLVQAADQARQRYAYREAVASLQAALQLLARLPEGRERTRRELEIRLGFARALQSAISPGAQQHQPNMSRARELCVELVDRPALALVLSWQARFEFVRSNPAAMRAVSWMQKAIGAEVEAPPLSMQIDTELGNAAMLEGALDEAEHYHRLAVSEPEDPGPRETAALLGHDPGSLAWSLGGVVAWLRGRPEQARRRTDAALSRALESGDPYMVAVCTAVGALVAYFRRDRAAVRSTLASLEAQLQAYGLGFAYLPPTVTRGWLLAEGGEPERAIAALQAGWKAAGEAGTTLFASVLFGSMAAVHLARGAAPAGLDAIEKGLAFVESHGERVWEAELHRVRGELLLRGGAAERAESAMRRALDVARSQGARSLELRAATSLARLWLGGPRRAEAHALLQSVYAAFTEGLDTADLRDAKHLLATTRP